MNVSFDQHASPSPCETGMALGCSSFFANENVAAFAVDQRLPPAIQGLVYKYINGDLGISLEKPACE